MNDTMNFTDINTLAIALMRQHGLIDQGWHFEFDRAKSRLGACHHGKKKITLSSIISPGQSRARIVNTILHEIAHALVGHKAAHGPMWKAKALEIGCDGERCGEVEAFKPEFRWYAVCDKCDLRVGIHRAPNRVRSCFQCAPWGFSTDHLMSWEQFGQRMEPHQMPTRYQQEWNRIQLRVNGGSATVYSHTTDTEEI